MKGAQLGLEKKRKNEEKIGILTKLPAISYAKQIFNFQVEQKDICKIRENNGEVLTIGVFLFCFKTGFE